MAALLEELLASTSLPLVPTLATIHGETGRILREEREEAVKSVRAVQGARSAGGTYQYEGGGFEEDGQVGGEAEW